MYDLNRVKSEFYAACESQGMDLKIPVTINGRLTRTLGRVKFTRSRITGKCELLGVEFSRQLLETSSDKSVRDVILHEAAHAIATYKDGSHGHDAYFKSICAALGTDNDGVATEVERTVDVRDKYEVFCSHCGKIGGFSRMCKTIREIDNCHCKKCGSIKLNVVQNW